MFINSLREITDDIGFAKKYHNVIGTDADVSELYFNPNTKWSQKYPSDKFLSDALVNSYAGSAYTGGRDWASDLTMMKWARAVMDYYNRDVPGRTDGKHWSDRSDLFFFDAAVKYFKKFNYHYKYTVADCEMLKEQLPAIDAEVTSVYNRRAAGAFGTGEQGHFLTVLADLKQKISQSMAELNCDQYLTNQENNQILDTQFQQIQQAQSLVKSDKTGTYVVYGMIGIIVIVTVIFIIKK